MTCFPPGVAPVKRRTSPADTVWFFLQALTLISSLRLARAEYGPATKLLDPTPGQADAAWRENEPHMLPADDEPYAGGRR